METEVDNLHKLDGQEISVLRDSVSELSRVFDKKFSRNAVAKMLAYISFENKEFSSHVMKALLSWIQASDFDKLYFYQRPIVQMILINDEFTKERIKKALGAMIEYLKHDGNYYKYGDTVINIMHKILKRSPVAAQVFKEFQNQTMRTVETWQN